LPLIFLPEVRFHLRLILIIFLIFMDKSLKIAWIGTGVMGAHMCRHILNKGYGLSVFSRTQSKAQQLIDLGAKWS
jgi:glutamyl-tRNA reductase